MARTAEQAAQRNARRQVRWGRFAYALPAVFVGAAVSAFSPWAWLVWLTDGLRAALIIVAGTGWGAWPVAWTRLGDRPFMAQVLLAAAVGNGILGAAALALGVAGWLNAASTFALLAVGAVLGLWRYRPQLASRAAGKASPAQHPPQAAHPDAPRILPRIITLAALALPLAVLLVAAALPPGVLWSGEARGYDVLEYHLQAPREYFNAGRVHFLPYNVYAAFPQQIEIQYLLLMYLGGSPIGGALSAQLLHALFGVLAVATLAGWARPGWPRCVVAVAAGSVPWVAYLGALAYVENGLLWYSAAATVVLVGVLRGEVRPTWRVAVLAGLCAGWAGACKYTALALVPAAAGGLLLFILPGALRLRVRFVLTFAAGAALAFAPWALRNWHDTGNPVYPFAYSIFGGAAWSPEQAAQWATGHRVPAESASFTGRAALAWRELPAAALFGGAIFLAALVALCRRWDRAGSWLLAWAALMILIWATTTYMPGRFMVPIVIPLALIAAGAADETGGRCAQLRRGVVLAIVLAGALWNARTLLNLLHAEHAYWLKASHGKAGLPTLLAAGPELFSQVNLLNDPQRIPPGARLWLIGDARAFYLTPLAHYTVVFSRDPFLAYAERAAPADAVAWLRTRGVTHLVFSWPEIERLRRTYGFPTFVTPTWVDALVVAGLQPAGWPADERAVYDVYAIPTE